MKILKWSIINILAGVVFFSCLPDVEDENIPINKETISAKWNVNSSDELYKSFEFDENSNYLIVMNQVKKSTSQDLHFMGSYEISGSRTIKLNDFGTIEVQMLNSKDASFTIKLNDNTTNKVNVVKGEKISSTVKTKQLCRIWKREPYPSDSFLKDWELRILFSNSGTYFISLIDPEKNSMGALNYWKWEDEQEKSVCYSNTSPVLCIQDRQLEIVELKDNILKVKHSDGLVESYFPTGTLK
jgi:hypothetical protein